MGRTGSLCFCRGPVNSLTRQQQWSFLAINAKLFKGIVSFWLRSIFCYDCTQTVWFSPWNSWILTSRDFFPQDIWEFILAHGPKVIDWPPAWGVQLCVCNCTDSSSHPGYFKPCFLEGSFEHFCSFNELHWKIVLWSRGSTRAEMLSKPSSRSFYWLLITSVGHFAAFCCCSGVSTVKWSDNRRSHCLQRVRCSWNVFLAPCKVCVGSAALPWALLAPHTRDSDWRALLKGFLIWTARHCGHVGTCCVCLDQPLSLSHRTSKHKTSSWKRKINLLNSLRKSYKMEMLFLTK